MPLPHLYLIFASEDREDVNQLTLALERLGIYAARYTDSEYYTPYAQETQHELKSTNPPALVWLTDNFIAKLDSLSGNRTLVPELATYVDESLRNGNRRLFCACTVAGHDVNSILRSLGRDPGAHATKVHNIDLMQYLRNKLAWPSIAKKIVDSVYAVLGVQYTPYPTIHYANFVLTGDEHGSIVKNGSLAEDLMVICNEFGCQPFALPANHFPATRAAWKITSADAEYTFPELTLSINPDVFLRDHSEELFSASSDEVHRGDSALQENCGVVVADVVSLLLISRCFPAVFNSFVSLAGNESVHKILLSPPSEPLTAWAGHITKHFPHYQGLIKLISSSMKPEKLNYFFAHQNVRLVAPYVRNMINVIDHGFRLGLNNNSSLQNLAADYKVTR